MSLPDGSREVLGPTDDVVGLYLADIRRHPKNIPLEVELDLGVSIKAGNEAEKALLKRDLCVNGCEDVKNLLTGDSLPIDRVAVIDTRLADQARAVYEGRRAQSELFHARLAWVFALAKAHCDTRAPFFMDVVQAGNSALLNAVAAYDPSDGGEVDPRNPDKALAFSSRARWKVKDAILEELGIFGYSRSTMPDVIDDDLTIYDFIADDPLVPPSEEVRAQARKAERVNQLLEIVNPNELAVLRLVYMERFTIRDAAQELNRGHREVESASVIGLCKIRNAANIAALQSVAGWEEAEFAAVQRHFMAKRVKPGEASPPADVIGSALLKLRTRVMEAADALTTDKTRAQPLLTAVLNDRFGLGEGGRVKSLRMFCQPTDGGPRYRDDAVMRLEAKILDHMVEGLARQKPAKVGKQVVEAAAAA